MKNPTERSEKHAPLRRWMVLSSFVLLVAVVLVVLPGMAAEKDLPGVVATVNGQPILAESVEESVVDQLDAVAMERLKCEVDADRTRHEVVEAATERAIRRQLLTLESEDRGLTENEIVAEIRTNAGTVTDADVDAWWNANGARVNRPREQVEGQIRQLLERDRLQAAEAAHFDALREKYEVELLLDAFRLEVAADGFPAKGAASPAVTIVEFSDFQCPYCARVTPTLDRVIADYGDQVRLVFRNFPLSNHPQARKAAEAALCAEEQGKFWQMHDLMFAEQSALGVPELKEKATRLGLDTAEFTTCLDSDKYARQVQADLEAGQVVGVSGTPAMFINGRYLSGAVPYEDVAALVRDELGRR